MPDETCTDPLAWLSRELAALSEAGLRRSLAQRQSPQGPAVTIDDRELVNFGSNDYLGLAADERLVAAAIEAARMFGWGAGASPLVTGRATPHAQLERQIAEFEGAEAALVFPSGFATNAGVIPALVGDGDAIYADAKNHASLIDGCRLARATRFIYRHGDLSALARKVATTGEFRRRLIVTDSLFSMDGDLAPLEELAELAARHNAMLLVDEAHATGVFGERGRGVVEHLAAKMPVLEETPTVRIGTLSKALGSSGGFVCGSRQLIDWLANRVRPYVFSTAPPPAAAAAASAALAIVNEEPHRRRELLVRAAMLRSELQAQGWNTGQSESQIIPLIVGAPDATMHLAGELRNRGFFVPGIRPPTVPKGESLLRISLCWNHTEEAIAELARTLAMLRPSREELD